jgi:hypothetical protein
MRFHCVRKMYICLLVRCHLIPIWPPVLPLNLTYILRFLPPLALQPQISQKILPTLTLKIFHWQNCRKHVSTKFRISRAMESITDKILSLSFFTVYSATFTQYFLLFTCFAFSWKITQCLRWPGWLLSCVHSESSFEIHVPHHKFVFLSQG